MLILHGKKSKEKKEKKKLKEQTNDELNKQDVKPKCHTAVRGFSNYSDCPRCSTLKKEEDCIKDKAYYKKETAYNTSEKIITKSPCCFWK